MGGEIFSCHESSIMPDENPLQTNKIAFIILTTVLSGIITIFGWWISNTHNKLNLLQIEMAKNSEVVSNIKEKIDSNLKMKDDLQDATLNIALVKAEVDKHEQYIKGRDNIKFDMQDYDKYIKPVIEDLISRITKLEQKVGSQ